MSQGAFVSRRSGPGRARARRAAGPATPSRPVDGPADPTAASATLPRADPAVARWIRRTLDDDPPRARSLIVTVWGDALAPHGGAVWLGGLIRLLEPLGINERLTRTSVFRLARDGWLSAESRGRQSRYRLTAEGRSRFEAAYRRIYAPPVERWDGEWEMVVDPPDGASAPARSALRESLGWEGFGVLVPGVHVRPRAGPSEGPAPALPPEAQRTLLLRVRDQDDLPAPRSLALRADRLWDLRALAADYRRFLALFGGVIERFRMRDIAASDPEQCFVVRTLLIHAYRRVMLRDPRLPPALLPLDWPGAAAFALTRDFYRLTQARAEAHLAATLEINGSRLPPADRSFHHRFGGLDARPARVRA
jgi:phenylacetic acid degradation operon negative regulatory protein